MSVFDPSSRAGKAFALAVGILFPVVIIGLALTPRDESVSLITWYATAAILYGLCLYLKSSWQWWLVVGILSRCALLFTFPALSDDVYRFFWDGSMIAHLGMSPYDILPSVLLHTQTDLPLHFEQIFPLLNSPDYHTVYPPALQFWFALSAWVGGYDVGSFAVVLKLVFLVAECITLRWMYLLLKEDGHVSNIIFYALNPLVLIEGVGNLHAEILVICFLMGMYYFLRRTHVWRSGVMISLAISTKLLPAIFLPFAVLNIPRKKRWAYAGFVSALTICILLPAILPSGGKGLVASLDLYYRSFEFNASLYYILRWIGEMTYGYNIIALSGPACAVVVLLAITWYWWSIRHRKFTSLPVVLIVVLTIYLFGSTTVHPWYLCPLVALCVFTRFRFVVVWSVVIFLTYTAYRMDPPSELLWLVVVEYAIVGTWLLAESLRQKPDCTT